jgi:hypothetical protein
MNHSLVPCCHAPSFMSGRARHGGNPASVWGNIVVASIEEEGIDGELRVRDGGGQMKRFRSADALFLCTALAFGLMSLALPGAAMKATPKPFEG